MYREQLIIKNKQMKRLAIILSIIPLIFSACIERPEAGFFTSNVVVEVGEPVYFTNNSFDAVYFEWDFGDGAFTDEPNPIHTYTATGTYDVTLSAWSKNDRVDRAYQDITVLYPTTLEIIVKEYYDEYRVANANVRLYPTYDDWLDETNMVIEGNTNQNGKVIFSRLQPAVYYVDVWEAQHNNFTLADEDIDWIRIPQLVANDINSFVAWVDYDPSKGTERDRSDKIEGKNRKFPKTK